jgi:hypothetical protein
MRLFYRPLLIGCFLALTGSVFAQQQRPDSFPANTNAFLTVLGTFMNAQKMEQLEKTYKDFASVYQGGLFSELEAARVVQTCNEMLTRRLIPNPHFQAYLRTLAALKKNVADEKVFFAWHTILDSLIIRKDLHPVNHFSDFLSFSNGLFEKKALKVGDVAGTTWFIDAPSYVLKYAKAQPFLQMDQGNLIAMRKEDSIRINKTSGAYYPFQSKWQGKGGKVTWERLKLDSLTYAQLKNYTLDVRLGLYDADDAELFFPLYFGNKKIEGDFSDKISSENSTSYPRFVSKDKNLDIKDFGEGIHFKGGFDLEGTTVYGTGTNEKKALIEIFNNRKERVFKGSANRFTIRRGELVLGEGVESTFYFKKDSIYHPSSNFRYVIKKKQLILSRGDRGSDRNPFYSSYHHINIDSDNITAYINADSVLIGQRSIPILRKEPVRFESLDFFNKQDYEQIQSISTTNPLVLINLMATTNNSRFIDADDLAARINPSFKVENITSLIYDLMAKGFVRYDSDKKEIEVQDKVKHFVNSSQGREDYDYLRINSVTDSANAVWNLRKNTVTVKGVKYLELSKRQSVGIKPDSATIVIKNNRNMDLDGLVKAGYTELLGRKFHFDYEKFMLLGDSIKRFRIFVPDKRPSENKGDVNAFSLTSDIENFSAALIIDAQSNKSGKDNIPMFPSLNSKSKSYVYYDSKYVKDTVYKRDTFFFILKPFNFNRLDDFVKEEVSFKGTLASAGIFPRFDEVLQIRPEDYSLGFIHKTPETGYPIYAKKGKFKGEVDLSNKGLRGKGNLVYLGASLDSEDILFWPERLSASAKAFDLDEKREKNKEEPKVHGELVRINWLPYKDSLNVSSEKNSFDLFKSGEHEFFGTLTLTPSGLKGNGTLDWPQASLQSKGFSFGAYSSRADTTNLKIKAAEAGSIAIKSDGVKSDVDFDKQIAKFKSNKDLLKTELPFNKYETSMNEFSWDMKGATVTFKANEAKPGLFASTDIARDSLKFQGRKAFYDLKSYQLLVDEVPFIRSADAMIYPDSNHVEILPGGALKTLENATIVCDTITKNHKINRATVNIQGRKEYRASGFYEYNIGKRKQEIEFQNIVGQRVGKGARSEKATSTRAEGQITEADSFFIDHKTAFYGAIRLGSESVNLDFDGFARLDADKLQPQNWFTVRSFADKKNLIIKFNRPKSTDGVPLETGLFLSKETSVVYPRIMMTLYFRKDRGILPVSGVFKYDLVKDQFIFGDSAKIYSGDPRGNRLVFSNKTGKVDADGRFNLGTGLKYVNIDAVGTASTQILNLPDSLMEKTPPPPVNLDVIAGLKLRIPDKLAKIMLNEIQSAGAGNTINYLTDLDYFTKRLYLLFPPDKGQDESIAALSSGVLELNNKTNDYSFLLSNLKLRWDVDYQSFVSTNTNMGLMTVNGESVGQMMTGYLETKMPSNDDDRLYFYLKLPNDIFYYFGYKQGVLEMTSNDNNFTSEIEKMKKTDLIFKMPDGENFEIQLVEANRAQMFVQRVKSAGK